MAVEFRIASHAKRKEVTIVEVLIESKVVAVIYPEDEKGIKIVSAHFESTVADEGFAGAVMEDDGSSSFSPIPSVHIKLNPSPYTITGGKIVKIPLR